jgi:hypothetical protein
LAIVLLLTSLSVVAGEGSAFEEPGVFSVESPGMGYEWKKVQEETVDGVKGAHYACLKAGSKEGVVLTVEFRDAMGDAGRRATLKGHYNGLYNALQKSGTTIVASKRPMLDSPIPDRVPYGFKLQTSDGIATVFDCMTVFGRRIYMVQAVANTEEQAKKLLDGMISTFKEQSDEGNGLKTAAISKSNKKDQSFVHKGLFSISLPDDCFEIIALNEENTTDYYMYPRQGGAATDPYLVCVKAFDAAADSDEKKRERIDVYLTKGLSEAKHAKDKDKEWPVIATKKPERLEQRVRCSMTKKGPTGGLSFNEAVLIFDKKTFIIEVFGPNSKEAEQRLLEVEKKFKILKEE